jgi:molybdopterin-binding protein
MRGSPHARRERSPGVNEINAAAYARAGVDLLVTSAPYAAPPLDVGGHGAGRDVDLRHLRSAPAMKLSARNVLAGKVVEVRKGATTAHVRLELPGGAVITASITNEAVDELGLKAGDQAYAVVKASDVMVGKD